ncbi:MAG: D-alanyl-D-alanine carboxypeptidase [Flavobacteriaceae bacterium]|nr:D-alanyl-D-alanine carboxypeptidase [Flavobacteriaceae bacterium]
MNRKHFFKTTILGGLSIIFLPLNSFHLIQKKYSKNQLLGKENPDLTGDTYASKMNKEAKVAFEKMKTAALKDGINIEVVSAYRSFQKQKNIFENKYKKFTNEGLAPVQSVEKIIEYSTIPGTSRHHWGTDIDIIDANYPKPISVLEEENFYGNGPYCQLKNWMDRYSESYGFFEVYTKNPNRKGVKYEPWHFSYAPVSKPMLKEYQKLDIKSILQEEKILGHECFTEEFIFKYKTENILDINPQLF